MDQAAPLRPLPDNVTDLDHFRVVRHDRIGGIHPPRIPHCRLTSTDRLLGTLRVSEGTSTQME
jgi:hypothetical protein